MAAMTTGEIVQYEAPIEGGVADVCGAAETSCVCTLKPHADGPHACGCGGSWEWRDGEFIAHSLPLPSSISPLATAFMISAAASWRAGDYYFLRRRRQDGPCYAIAAGMVHIKPACRCPKRGR